MTIILLILAVGCAYVAIKEANGAMDQAVFGGLAIILTIGALA